MRNAKPFPDFLPDQLPGDILTRARNCYAAANGYRPVKAFQSISPAIGEAFEGGAAFLSSSGTAYLLVGTPTKLRQISGGAWIDLATGIAAPENWRFTQFGNYVVTVNGGVTRALDMGTGAFVAIPGAPVGTSVATVGAHVVIGAADGDKHLVKWSAFNNHTGWTPAVNQSGFEPMRDGGEVMGMAGGEYGVVLQRFRLTRMSLTGDATAPFAFQEITSNFGCASKSSVVQAGRTVFFWSDRGFVALEDGASVRPIGNERFDESFRKSIGVLDYESIWSAVDPKRSLVIWMTPGTPGVAWVYNWVLDKTTTIEMPMTGLFSGFSSNVTLEQVSALYPNLDTMPYSLDDARFKGGDPSLYFVNNTVGAMDGNNMPVSFRMGWQAPHGTQRARVQAMWPITDAVDGMTGILDVRQRMGDGEVIRVKADLQASGRIPLRASGRYVALGLDFAENAEWSFVQGYELESSGAGWRTGQ